LGDNENAIEIQIWVAILANLINHLGQKQIKTFLGIFKSCIGNTPTINELYQYE
jgi:hypothetical protein